MITHIGELSLTLYCGYIVNIFRHPIYWEIITTQPSLRYCLRSIGFVRAAPKEHIINIVGLVPSSGSKMYCIRLPKDQ